MRATPTISNPRLRPAARHLGWVHSLLTVQSVVIVLLSINRLSALTLSYVAANQFLRWVDFNNMLVLPLISLIGFYLLKKHLEYDNAVREGFWQRTLGLTFMLGVYLLGAGYGDHEVTNYLHARFCGEDQRNDICRIIIFNDDEFSHWVFFAGFVLTNAVIMLTQIIFPWSSKLTRQDSVLLVVNGLFIALGIFANLAFEVIELDLYIVALLALMAIGLLWRYGKQPLLIYYSTAYCLGLLATGLYKAIIG